MFANLLKGTSLGITQPPLNSQVGALTKGLGSKLSGLASGGTLGAVTSLLTGITSLFKGSPPTYFAEKGKIFIGTIIPQIQTQYANDFGKMLTEMSKAYNYMVVHYQAHLSGSTSERSKTGNQMGMDYVKSFEPTFNQFVSQLRQTHNITTSQVSVTFQKNQLQGIKPFSGNHQGSYTQFTAVEKNIIESTFGGSSNTSRTLSKGSSTAAGVGFMALILGGMFFPQIKKVLKIK